MKSLHLNGLIIRLAEAAGHPVDAFRLNETFSRSMDEDLEQEEPILHKLSEIGNFAGISLLKRSLSLREYKLLLEGDFPPHIFLLPGLTCFPVVISKQGSEFRVSGYPGGVETNLYFKGRKELFESYDLEDLPSDQEMALLTAIPVEGVFTITGENKPHPLKRFLFLLSHDRRDIYYILVYALIAGGLSLTLPIGVQTIINFIMSGAITDTMILLITAVVLGTLMTGGLQILQLILVETLQQRLFARTAFEFAFRIPRIQQEAFGKHYPPELMNRFFDVVNVQKGFSKMFTEFSAALLQAVFGLILLAFYHPLFIIFDLTLVAVVYFIFRVFSQRGLKSSLEESTYKYKAAAWIEEMARSLTTFKTAGYSNIAVEKMDIYTQGYLKARKSHFSILKMQFGGMVIFKTLVVAALLILGSFLVVSRDLSIGQFVAAEIVVILIINALEKIILFLEVIYDILTGIEKISGVTDLPLESGGTLMMKDSQEGVSLQVKNIRFLYPGSIKPVLQQISFEAKPGEKIILAGSPESGKNTLLMILGGSLTRFEGYMAYNGVSFRDLNLTDLRQQIGFFNRQNDIFEGTLEENLVLNQPAVTYAEMLEACKLAGLDTFLQNLQEGFQTRLPAAARTLSISVQRRIVIARALLGKPNLVLMDEDYSEFVSRKDFADKYDFFKSGVSKTLIAISGDPELMQRADRVLWIKEGRIWKEGTYLELSKDSDFIQACIAR